MKRPQGNILRPPGLKYTNAEKLPARFGELNAPRLLYANRIFLVPIRNNCAVANVTH
jgi:hypothetical protein